MEELKREWTPHNCSKRGGGVRGDSQLLSQKIKVDRGMQHNTTKICSFSSIPLDVVYQELEVTKLDPAQVIKKYFPMELGFWVAHLFKMDPILDRCLFLKQKTHRQFTFKMDGTTWHIVKPATYICVTRQNVHRRICQHLTTAFSNTFPAIAKYYVTLTLSSMTLILIYTLLPHYTARVLISLLVIWQRSWCQFIVQWAGWECWLVMGNYKAEPNIGVTCLAMW